MSTDFQEPGEVCQSCRPRWKKAGKPPVKLVALPSVSELYKEIVAVCPYCDGGALEVAQAAARRNDPKE